MHRVVDFIAGIDRLFHFDLTAGNKELNSATFGDTDLFSEWIDKKLVDNNCRYGIGGYNEHRTIYERSDHFNGPEESRRLHLGVDIWGPAGTSVYNFADGFVHSFKFNDNFGDYGSTIILRYKLNGRVFHVLYGHLSLSSLNDLAAGMLIPAGTRFAEFGKKEENGYWPPHLHFQVIEDMQGMVGDYPGVCQYSNRNVYLNNCPDPAFILYNTFETTSF
ncbi:MAG: peptidoglycan DD-metalloendopeptidase family protein [Bacteroidota bacterium]